METVGVPARHEAVLRLTNQLKMMMETGSCASVPTGLHKLAEIVDVAESRWLKEPGRDRFYFYQATANIEFVLERMRERFRKPGGDPGIARDALAVMPAIDDALKAAEVLEISEPAIDRVLKATWVLRKTAKKADLLKPTKLDDGARELLRKNLAPILDSLGARSKEGYCADD